ncbi:hypothetical protein ACWEP4_41435, partial [Streptomyces sp. NPDC004227]
MINDGLRQRTAHPLPNLANPCAGAAASDGGGCSQLYADSSQLGAEGLGYLGSEGFSKPSVGLGIPYGCAVQVIVAVRGHEGRA